MRRRQVHDFLSNRFIAINEASKAQDISFQAAMQDHFSGPAFTMPNVLDSTLSIPRDRHQRVGKSGITDLHNRKSNALDAYLSSLTAL
jgi:hypothetical protein